MALEIFQYPKAQHIRRLAPGPYTNYRSYKPYLRDEFGQTCVYCRMRDGWTPYGEAVFVVEHYLPKGKDFHPELETTYSNLYYACQTCNRNKHTWPYYWDSARKRYAKWAYRVPNPCDVVMAHHLWFDSSFLTVAAKSQDGKETIDLLDLNEPDSVKFRLDVETLVSKHRADVQRATRLLKKVTAALRDKKTDQAKIAPLQAAQQKLKNEISVATERLRDLLGP